MSLNIKNSQGMTMIEMAIAVAMISMVLVGILGGISFQKNSLQSIHSMITRDHFQDLIQKIATDSSLISRSINLVENDKFRACLMGGTHNTCNTPPCCNKGFNGSGNAFVFLDPAVPNETFSPATGETFSGTPANPKRYDVNGVKCVNPGPQCPFVMTTSFSATCPGGTDPCDKAQSILITYSFGMDQNPATGLMLPIRTSTVPVLGVGAVPAAPTLALCWTTGASCPSEPLNQGSWVTRTAPASVPPDARKMLISYLCSEVNLNIRALGSTADLNSTYLCYTSNGVKNAGQAWVPLSADLKYESFYQRTDPPSGTVEAYVIGWSK